MKSLQQTVWRLTGTHGKAGMELIPDILRMAINNSDHNLLILL